MKKINVLVTGGGSPGIAGTIYSLKNNYDKRDIKIICTDAKNDCVGRYFADGFYQIPKASDTAKYLKRLFDVCKNEKIEIILPQNTAELLILADNKELFANLGVKIIVSEQSNLSIANSKYELLRICENISIPYPKYFLVNNRNDLLSSAKKIGWPNNPFVVKLPASNGSRGLRIVDDNKNYKEIFLNDKPTSVFTKFETFAEMIGENFEPLLIMEYLSGEEVSVDVFRDQDNFISIPRIREEIRSGISFQNMAVQRYDLIQYSKILSDHLDLRYCYGFQFKYDSRGVPKILECNPRVQGSMVFATFMGANMVYFAIKSILNEPIGNYSLDWETKLLRYWGAVGVNNNRVIKI